MRVRRSRRNCGTTGRISPYALVYEAVEKGQRLGCIRIDDTGEDVTPYWSWVDPAHRRRGIGAKLYEAAARGACQHLKRPLSSAAKLSPEARAFWEKQVRKGRATCELYDGPTCLWYLLTCPPAKSLAGSQRRPR